MWRTVRLAFRAPTPTTYLDSGNEQGQLFDFIFQVLAIDDTTEVEHFGSIVNVRPEPLFEEFFGFSQVFGCPELIQMSEDPHHFGETVRLQYVEEFKRFHFKAKFGIDAQQHQVGNFGTVQHGCGVIGALKEGDAFVLAGYDCDWSCNCR